MAEYIVDACVEEELWGIWCFIAQDNPEAATCVVEAAFETFKLLATNPGLGRTRRFRNPKLKDIRSWLVNGFENYLVFYRPVAGGIQVLHVYHGARDIEALFDVK